MSIYTLYSCLKVSMIIPELWSSAKWGQGSFAANDQKIIEEGLKLFKSKE